MSTRGRKADLRVIEGGLKELPAAPSHVAAAMRPEWDAVVRDLHDRSLLTDAMLGVVAAYIAALHNCRKAQEAIEVHGALIQGKDGILKQNPAISLLGKSQQVVQRLSAELGLTPAARSREQMRGKEKDSGNGQLDFLDL